LESKKNLNDDAIAHMLFSIPSASFDNAAIRKAGRIDLNCWWWLLLCPTNFVRKLAAKKGRKWLFAWRLFGMHFPPKEIRQNTGFFELPNPAKFKSRCFEIGVMLASFT
jgi:hypothetical protein